MHPPTSSPETDDPAPRGAWTYRRGWACLALVLLAYFAPVVFLDHVIYPHDNAEETGRALEPGYAPSDYPSTNRLDDQSTAYIPELAHALGDDHAAWLPVWNPHNELGRPMLQHFGVSRAWIVGNAVSLFTRDPFRFYTWMITLAVCGAACMAYGFLAERALHPLACLAGALAISVGPFAAVWQTFPMLPWAFCWVFALLWGIERRLRRPGPWSAVAIVFAVHGLVMSGYPQHLVMLFWSLSGYVVVRVWQERADAAARARALALFAGCAVLGLLASAPMVADLLIEQQRSSRGDVSIDFVLGDVARVDDAKGLALSLLRCYDIFLGGNPLEPGFQRWLGVFRGYLFSPFYFGLLALAPLVLRRKQAWWWFACFVVAMVANHWAGLYRIGAEWMGMSFSNLPPMVGALLPAAVLCAVVVDSALRRELPQWAPFLAAVPAVCALALVQGLDVPLHPLYAALGVAAALGAVLFVHRPAWWTLLPFVVLVVFHHGRTLLVTRPRAVVSTDSELVRDLRARMPAGGRYAWVGRARGALLFPNQQMLVDLRSVHSYYSLQSRAFAKWAGEVSGFGGDDYHRRFLSVARPTDVDAGALAGAYVTHYLSREPLPKAIGAEVARRGPVIVTEARRPGPRAVAVAFDGGAEGDGVTVDPGLLLDPANAVGLTEFAPDLLRIAFDSAGDGARGGADGELIVPSVAYHPNWVARQGGYRLRTSPVNGRLLGIAGATHAGVPVELRYEPHVRHAWIAQVLFALAGAAFLVDALVRRRRRASARG